MADASAADRDLWQLGLAEAEARYRRQETDPVELVEAVLRRVAAVDPILNAFALLDVEGARAAAAQSARRWRQGEPIGPLDGALLSIKDNITVGGLPCCWGTEVFRDFVPERDELPVARLRAAGAVILGKTAVSEFSNGRGIVSTPGFGTTRNPWRPERTTGSSSGGAAAAVAAGMGGAALGTDGGGSIRVPASHCGLVGFKPSAGRVARAHGLPVILAGREVIGPLARSTGDVAMILDAIARPAPEDPLSWGFDSAWRGTAAETPARRRILYVRRIAGYPVDPAVDAACEIAAANLAALGHRVEEGEAPFDPALQAYSRVLVQAGMAWLLREREWRGRVDPYYARVTEAGARLNAADYVEALDKLREVQVQVGRFFEAYDLLLSPVTGDLPGPADQPAPDHYTVFTGFANTAGVPAVALPAMLSPDGLPVGFQLVARFGADWELLETARDYERRYPWADRRPMMTTQPV